MIIIANECWHSWYERVRIPQGHKFNSHYRCKDLVDRPSRKSLCKCSLNSGHDLNGMTGVKFT